MAQNFRRYTSNDVGTSAATLFTSDSYDTVGLYQRWFKRHLSSQGCTDTCWFCFAGT
jgi:hypothetical protein